MNPVVLLESLDKTSLPEYVPLEDIERIQSPKRRVLNKGQDDG
jgi:hypothetical protein